MSSNSTNTSSIVSKIWAFCNTLRDDGVGYGVITDEVITQSLQQAEALRQVIFKNAFKGRLVN